MAEAVQEGFRTFAEAVVEHDFAWVWRFGRLAKDYEGLPTALEGLRFVAFACLFLSQPTAAIGMSP